MIWGLGIISNKFSETPYGSGLCRFPQGLFFLNFKTFCFFVLSFGTGSEFPLSSRCYTALYTEDETRMSSSDPIANGYSNDDRRFKMNV